LANYLANSLGVDGVFLDKKLRVGAKGDDEMMWAAVSCKYFWCVLTKEFVQQWYPMRELMVGYIRYIQESGKDFVLIPDCLETGSHPPGTWMDQIFKLEALKLYNKNGTVHGFPANMLRNIPLESFDERFHRIAAMRMADGSIIKPNTRQADPAPDNAIEGQADPTPDKKVARMAALSKWTSKTLIGALPMVDGSMNTSDDGQADHAPDKTIEIATLPMVDGSMNTSDDGQADHAPDKTIEIATLPRADGSMNTSDDGQADPAPDKTIESSFRYKCFDWFCPTGNATVDKCLYNSGYGLWRLINSTNSFENPFSLFFSAFQGVIISRIARTSKQSTAHPHLICLVDPGV
jgi:hypothetical protein